MMSLTNAGFPEFHPSSNNRRTMTRLVSSVVIASSSFRCAGARQHRGPAGVHPPDVRLLWTGSYQPRWECSLHVLVNYSGSSMGRGGEHLQDHISDLAARDAGR